MSISSQPRPNRMTQGSDTRSVKRASASPPGKNPLMQLPIAQRLVLGFLVPALIAALIAGIIGVQSAQLLSQESNFYQDLFQSYSSLTTSNDFLQLMDFKINATMNDAFAPGSHMDQLALDRQTVQDLEKKYDALLNDYVQHGLLLHHPEQTVLFDAAGHAGLPGQQRILADSVERTWQLYRSTLDRVLQEIQDKHYQDAQTLLHIQGEATYTDALSALRQLIQFNGLLTTYVQDATVVQQRNELVTTSLAILILLLAIGLIGWLIYGTLVNRLHRLRTVAQAVQEGRTDTRAVVDGRDEITAVSASMNDMLDTIVGLFEETRVQHEALVNAAEHLFSDMRLANGGELEVRRAANNDPIGMLSNAFNFTIGRFRRFLLRNQTIIQQLETLSRYESEHVDKFLVKFRDLLGYVHLSPFSRSSSSGPSSNIPASLTPMQIQELIRLTEGFAQEVKTLTQGLHKVTHDMRTSLAPFRLETPWDNESILDSELRTGKGQK